MLINDDDVIATRVDAPAEISCKITIWLAPLNIIIDVAYVKYGPKPSSIPIAPNIIPNGTTGIIRGKTSIIPFEKVLDLEYIYLIALRAFVKYDLSKPQSL